MTTKKPTFLKREAIVLTKDIKKKVDVKLQECIDMAKKIWGHEHPMPDVRYDLKSLTCGMANAAWNRLRLHPIFLVENESDYLTETIPHEFAHLLVPHVGHKIREQWIKQGKMKEGDRFKRFMSHGPEWRAVMVAMGRGPKKGQKWKDVILHSYNPASIEMPIRKKHGPRKPGGKKVGEIILKIKSLKPEELEALKSRLKMEIVQAERSEPTPAEIQAAKEVHQLSMTLRNFNHLRPKNVASYAGWADNVIKNLG